MSSEFPFLGTTEPVQSNSLPLFKIWAWDFDKDNFIYDGNGKRILLTGNDALKVWIYKGQVLPAAKKAAKPAPATEGGR